MLEKVIDNIIRKIQSEVLTAQMDYIPLDYLLSRNIPGSVKHFFDQEVELWLREEAEKFANNERFDYDMPEVRVLIDKIFDILKNTANFHLNKFNQLLERAIKLQANYLTRPQQTLTQFLFKDSQVITTMEVYDMLKYFDKFQYYKDALTDYFNLKYLREISQKQFEELISGIDKQVYSKDPLNTALQTIKVIINFVNDGREPCDKLSVDLLTMAFMDRNLTDYAQLVKAEEADGVQELDIAELEALLRTGKTSRQRREPAEKEIPAQTIADIETQKPDIQVEDISVQAAPEPVVEVEEEEEELEEEEEIREPASKLSAADQLADFVAEKIKGDHLEDLERLISTKQRKRFIKKVFRKDESRYQKFTHLINQMSTWKQASVAIDEMFYQTGTNPYSKDALEYSDLIYSRYFPKDRKLDREQIT